MRNQITNLLKTSSKVLNVLPKQNYDPHNGHLIFKSAYFSTQQQKYQGKLKESTPTITSAPPLSVLKLGKLNHVAIATPNLEKATAMYRDILGATVSEPEDLATHGVTTVFVDLGNTKIELLHPFGEKSPIQKFLDKNKDGGIHHICVEVDNIIEAVDSIKAEGKIRILDPQPKIGAHGKLVVFLHPKDCGGVLIELEES